MSRFMLLLAVSFVSLSSLATVYKIDPSHTRIGFKIKHLAFASVSGQFKKFEGAGEFDEKTGKVTNAKVTIQVDSIFTDEPDRDKHLASPDFFDAAKFPTVTFELSEVIFEGADSARVPKKVKGKLTIRGVTKDVVLDVGSGGIAKDPWGNEKILFEGSGKIDRRDFGLDWHKEGMNLLSKLAVPLVGNEVTLDIAVEATKDVPKKK